MSLWQTIRTRLLRDHPYRDQESRLPDDLVTSFRDIGPETRNHLREIETALAESFRADPARITEIVSVVGELTFGRLGVPIVSIDRVLA